MKEVDFLFDSRTECTEQCLKRKRDQENEIRDMRKLINDKDERIKILDSETKVNETIRTKKIYIYYES